MIALPAEFAAGMPVPPEFITSLEGGTLIFGCDVLIRPGPPMPIIEPRDPAETASIIVYTGPGTCVLAPMWLYPGARQHAVEARMAAKLVVNGIADLSRYVMPPRQAAWAYHGGMITSAPLAFTGSVKT